jgi:hypothetical protein
MTLLPHIFIIIISSCPSPLLHIGGGMSLSALGMLPTIWPVLPALNDDDEDDDYWSSQRNDNWQGKPKYLEKSCYFVPFCAPYE